jgi:hypothetical protein
MNKEIGYKSFALVKERERIKNKQQQFEKRVRLVKSVMRKKHDYYSIMRFIKFDKPIK